MYLKKKNFTLAGSFSMAGLTVQREALVWAPAKTNALNTDRWGEGVAVSQWEAGPFVGSTLACGGCYIR